MTQRNTPVSQIQNAEVELVRQTDLLVKALSWEDFVMLCYPLLLQMGWSPLSLLHVTDKRDDMGLLQRATGEEAFLQMIPSVTEAELSHYQEKLVRHVHYDRLFVISQFSDVPKDFILSPNVHWWTDNKLARHLIYAGELVRLTAFYGG